MYNIRYAQKSDISTIAGFIGKYNSKHENHIGYCGTNEKEIASCLHKDQDLLLSFTLVYDQCELIALQGYDYYDNTAELWGPYINNSLEFKAIANILWEKMINRLPQGTTYHGFPNKDNNSCSEFYKSKGMRLKGNHEILECVLGDKQSFDYELLQKDDYDQFTRLHNDIFPNTYYTGEDITSMLDQNHVVVVSKVENILVGYAFAIIDDSLDGNIEFIGVNPKNRREGHGMKLLNMVLSWYMKKGSEKLILCVDLKNEKAISLYKKNGFIAKYSLEFYCS